MQNLYICELLLFDNAVERKCVYSLCFDCSSSQSASSVKDTPSRHCRSANANLCHAGLMYQIKVSGVEPVHVYRKIPRSVRCVYQAISEPFRLKKRTSFSPSHYDILFKSSLQVKAGLKMNKWL